MFHDWDIRLANYIESVREQSFDWAGFDCLHFVNEAVIAQRGEGFADDWLGNSKSPQSAYKHYTTLLRRFGYDTVSDAIDARLTRSVGLVPARGSVVGRHDPDSSIVGLSLGMAVSDLIAFVGHNGLVFSKPQPGDIFWSVS